MKRRSNGIIYVLVVAIVICLAAGGTGFAKSLSAKTTDNGGNNNNNNKKEYKVSYKYYLDGIESQEEIKDEKEQVASENFEGAVEEKRLYSFEKYTCSNEVEGTWDDENWKFVPTLTADTTCRLYFVKNTHEVKVVATNGTFDGTKNEATVKVDRDKEVNVTIIPTPGYKFTKVDCSNRTEANYDQEKNVVTIKNVTKDSECMVTYAISAYNAEVRVQNGSIAANEEKKTANYGETLTFSVTPSENYDNPTIDCTNGQNGHYSNGTFTISPVTNDTVCTVSFTIAKNKVTLNIENGTIINTDNSEHPNIKETTNNGIVTFGISKNDGYLLTDPELSCNDENVSINYASGTITIQKVTKDTVCTVKLKKDETSNNNEGGNEAGN